MICRTWLSVVLVWVWASSFLLALVWFLDSLRTKLQRCRTVTVIENICSIVKVSSSTMLVESVSLSRLVLVS